MSDTITDRLIAFCSLDVPENAAQMMRLSLFDWAACGIAGARETEFVNFRSSLTALYPGAHRVFGTGSTSAPTAALINGTLSHALDYDDTHFAHIGHPTVAVVPAVLALAEQTHSDLRSLIDAATIGVEASILVGLWLGRDHYQMGYHQTATAGAFGATLGACRLLELTQNELRNALGLCASMASGLKVQFGTMAKPLNAGLAARTGIEAALWAQSGMSAAHDGLAGPLGFGPTHHGQDVDVNVSRESWRILDISHKFHACCHGLHAMLEALREAGLRGADVESLHIHTHPRWMSVCNIQCPETGLSVKFSYVQTAAMVLSGYDTGDITSFSDQIAQDAELAAMRRRISVSEDSCLTETQTVIKVVLNNRDTRHLTHDLLTPMTSDTRAAKLRAKAKTLVGEHHVQTLWNAAQGNNLGNFIHQLTME
ncbi:MAG: MmgE/PrpD family protein [Granulosicoccus sp.]